MFNDSVRRELLDVVRRLNCGICDVEEFRSDIKFVYRFGLHQTDIDEAKLNRITIRVLNCPANKLAGVVNHILQIL